MKKIVLSLVIIFSIVFVNAQDMEIKNPKKSQLSFGFNIGAPVGKTTSALIQFVVGADLQYAYFISDKFAVTASGGLDIWHPRKNNRNYVPLLGGVKLFLSDKIYFSEQAGYAVGISKNTAIPPVKIKGAFTDVAGIGIKISPSSDLLIAYKGLFYSGASQNTIDLRISYNFGK